MAEEYILKPMLLDETYRSGNQALLNIYETTNQSLVEAIENIAKAKESAEHIDHVAGQLVNVYNNVAEMKQSTRLKVGMATKTLGYYSTNDGGGAYYVIRAKQDSDVDDGGSLHELANGLVAELIVENGTVNVKQFGAKGDGIADDTQAIQKAINSGRKVKLLNGTYKITSTLILRSGLFITGVGRKRSFIKSTAGGFVIPSSVDASHITMKDFSIIGNDSDVGIDISGSRESPYNGGRYSFFDNVDVSKFDTCIKTKGVWCVKFTHCRFDGIKYGVCQDTVSNNIIYDSCQFLGTDTSFIGLKMIEAYQTSINDCDFERCNIAINMSECHSVKIAGGYFEGCNYVVYGNYTPGLIIENIYTLNCKYIGLVENTIGDSIYKDCVNIFRNISCKSTWDADTELILVSSPAKVYYENICVNNLSTDNNVKIYSCSTDSKTWGTSRGLLINTVSISNFDLAKWGKVYFPTYQITHKSNDNFKLINAYAIIGIDFTLSKSSVVCINNNEKEVYRLTLPAKTYTVGEKVVFSRSTSNPLDMIIPNIEDILALLSTSSGLGETLSLIDIYIDIASGKIYT